MKKIAVDMVALAVLLIRNTSIGEGKTSKKALGFALCLLLVACLLFPAASAARPAEESNTLRIMLKTSIELTPEIVQQLTHLAVHVDYVFEEIDAMAMSIREANLARLRQLDIVERIEIDRKVYALEIDQSHTGGLSTWNLDMINVVDYGAGRTIGYDGDGVYIAVLDTGLVPNWRDYFHEDRIAVEYGAGFHNPPGNINPNAWRDTNSHGTHVTSTILGYYLDGVAWWDFPPDWYDGESVDGVAPKATVIPVKVLGNKGWGWDSSLVAGILYIAGLKDGDPENGEIDAPMVINMSLGAPYPLEIERSAIEYAINQGIIVVAAAGNLGVAGMDWPGAYPEVISAGACGWTLEVIGDLEPTLPWWRDDVFEYLGTPDILGNAFQAYITDFSGRELPGSGLYEQDLDVVAPGSWVIGPCMLNGIAHPRYTPPGKPREYYPVGGTSVSAPHISGIVALMLQVDLEQNGNQTLDAPQVETILENTALPIPALISSAWVFDPFLGLREIFWNTDATGAGLVQADAAIDPLNW